MTLHATQILARQAVSFSLTTIPDDVQQIAIRALIDTLGVAFAGSHTRTARRLMATVNGTGQSGILGSSTYTHAPEAARINGCSAHLLDFDDNCYSGFVHGSAIIIPAALAVAQQQNSSGADLLAAIVAGSECQYRLGEALGNYLYHQGWWTTSVLGVVGAAVAAACLLRLDSLQMAHAIAIALSATGGNKSAFGSDAKALMAGLASERGVQAALMAQQGLTGPLDILEHHFGLPALMNNSHWYPKKLCADGWRLLTPGLDIKRIPVCLSAHAAVDATAHLIRLHKISPEDILQIQCDVPEIVATNLIYSVPETPQQAQFSLPFAIAASLYFHELTLDQLTESVLSNPEIHHLMAKVVMTTSDQWSGDERQKNAPEGAHVTLHLFSGKKFSGIVEQALGSSLNPLNDSELNIKFLSCANRAFSEETSGKLLSQLRQIKELSSVMQLSSLLENTDHEF